MFSHAKFVNSPNVPDITVNNDTVDDRYTSIENVHQPTTSGQSGLENPLYEARTGNAGQDQSARNTLPTQEFQTVDMTSYKYWFYRSAQYTELPSCIALECPQNDIVILLIAGIDMKYIYLDEYHKFKITSQSPDDLFIFIRVLYQYLF